MVLHWWRPAAVVLDILCLSLLYFELFCENTDFLNIKRWFGCCAAEIISAGNSDHFLFFVMMHNHGNCLQVAALH